MDSASFLISMAILAGVMGYIVWPWFKARELAAQGLAPEEPAFLAGEVDLNTKREKLVAALRDLEFDYVVEKVTPADYESLRNHLLSQVAEVMTQQEASTDAAIDALLNRARAKTSATATEICTHCGESVRAGARFCVYCGEKLSQQHCPDCGSPANADDQFCSICGFNLETLTMVN